MEGAAVELGDREHAGLPLRVRPNRRVVAAERQHRGIRELDLHRVARELRLGPDELEATLLANGAAAAVTAHEKARAKALAAGVHRDVVPRGLEAFDTFPALDLHPE